VELEKVAFLVQLVGVAVQEHEDALQLGEGVLADLHDGRLVCLYHGQRARRLTPRARVRARRVLLGVEACGRDGERGRVRFFRRRGPDGGRGGRGRGGRRGGRRIAAVESIATACGGSASAEKAQRRAAHGTYPHSDMKERTAGGQ
jgi:hypothetical protein